MTPIIIVLAGGIRNVSHQDSADVHPIQTNLGIMWFELHSKCGGRLLLSLFWWHLIIYPLLEHTAEVSSLDFQR